MNSNDQTTPDVEPTIADLQARLTAVEQWIAGVDRALAQL